MNAPRAEPVLALTNGSLWNYFQSLKVFERGVEAGLFYSKMNQIYGIHFSHVDRGRRGQQRSQMADLCRLCQPRSAVGFIVGRVSDKEPDGGLPIVAAAH